MKQIELFMNMLYYCNYMIVYKVQKGFDWLVFSILDNTCTRKFCKSNGYWEYVNRFKQNYNKMMRCSENKKKPPGRILSMADKGIIFFLCINVLTMLNVIAMITVTGACDLFNNEIVWGLLLIVGGFIIYFTHNVFIDRKDKYVTYFKKFGKQKFLKLFIWYVLSYGMAIACYCFSLKHILIFLK